MQRGLWTFLFFTLVGPFFAAVVVFLALPLLIQFQAGPFAGGDYGVLAASTPPESGQILAFSAMTAVRAYVWAAIPAALAGLLFAILVVRDWPSGYGMAGMAGVIGFMIAVIIFPIPDGGLLVYAAVLAGFIAIACRAVLERAGVINPQGDA